jgi:hypothetical protein
MEPTTAQNKTTNRARARGFRDWRTTTPGRAGFADV